MDRANDLGGFAAVAIDVATQFGGVRGVCKRMAGADVVGQLFLREETDRASREEPEEILRHRAMTTATKAPRRLGKGSGDGRGTVTSGRASRRASGDEEATTSEPVGARIRRLREAAGLSQRVLARLLSRKDGRSEGAWQASLARTETSDIEPPAEQLDSILRELGDDEEGRARAAVASVLTAEVLADWCTRHDPVEISRALASYATMVPMMARRNR